MQKSNIKYLGTKKGGFHQSRSKEVKISILGVLQLEIQLFGDVSFILGLDCQIPMNWDQISKNPSIWDPQYENLNVLYTKSNRLKIPF